MISFFLGFNLSSGGVVVRILITTLPKNLREAKADTHGENNSENSDEYIHMSAFIECSSDLLIVID
jgi:hypothetical protein